MSIKSLIIIILSTLFFSFILIPSIFYAINPQPLLEEIATQEEKDLTHRTIIALFIVSSSFGFLLLLYIIDTNIKDRKKENFYIFQSKSAASSADFFYKIFVCKNFTFD